MSYRIVCFKDTPEPFGPNTARGILMDCVGSVDAETLEEARGIFEDLSPQYVLVELEEYLPQLEKWRIIATTEKD